MDKLRKINCPGHHFIENKHRLKLQQLSGLCGFVRYPGIYNSNNLFPSWIMLKICNPESLCDMQIPYKICFPFSGSGSSAIQGNPKDWPHIILYRKFMPRKWLIMDLFRPSFCHSHLHNPLQTVLSISLLHFCWTSCQDELCFFKILMFICKIFQIPAKSPLCPCPVLVLSSWNIMFPLAAQQWKQGFSWKMKKY